MTNSQSAKGNDSPDPIYQAVGHALSEWESLEYILAHFFQAMLQTKSIGPFRAYGTVQGFQARADMLIAAAEVFFYEMNRPDLLKEFKSLINDLKNGLSSIRNNIAHGSVGLEEDGYWLSPAGQQTKKLHWSGDRSYRYNASQIDQHRENFKQAAVEISKFFSQIFFGAQP